MRILFVTYPWAGLNKGGLQLQIDETRNALMSLGINVDLYNPWKCDLSIYDVIHVFSINPAVKPFVDAAKQRGIAVVVSPIFSAYDRSELAFRIRTFLSKKISGVFSVQKSGFEILASADLIIALSVEEKNKLENIFNVDSTKVEVIPNGVKEHFFHDVGDEFESRYNVKDYVLTVGRIEEWKNQYKLIEVCKKLGKTLVIVGPENERSTDYYSACKEISNANVIFTGAIANDNPLLVSAYKSADIFALVSKSEVFPLTVLEAASSNCKLLITDNCAIKSIFKNEEGVSFTKPSNNNIEKKMLDLIEHKKPNLREKIKKEYTWSFVAGKLEKLYAQVS